MNSRTRAEEIAARLVETGCSVIISNEPRDGSWWLTVRGQGSGTATLEVPADPAERGLRLVVTWPDSEKDTPRHAARLRRLSEMFRSWGFEVVNLDADNGDTEATERDPLLADTDCPAPECGAKAGAPHQPDCQLMWGIEDA